MWNWFERYATSCVTPGGDDVLYNSPSSVHLFVNHGCDAAKRAFSPTDLLGEYRSDFFNVVAHRHPRIVCTALILGRDIEVGEEVTGDYLAYEYMDEWDRNEIRNDWCGGRQ